MRCDISCFVLLILVSIHSVSSDTPSINSIDAPGCKDGDVMKDPCGRPCVCFTGRFNCQLILLCDLKYHWYRE